MTTDTSKITNAANDLSSGLTSGGTAAKKLGQEIANTIVDLDARISALETAATVPPEVTGPTGGLITNFIGTNGYRFPIDGIDQGVNNASKPYSLTMIDAYTLRYEIRQGDAKPNDSASVDRSAIQSTRLTPDKTVSKIAYRLLIEPGPVNTAAWFVMGQQHNDDGELPNGWGTSPPFAVELIGEKFSVVARHSPVGGNPSNGSGSTLVSTRPWTQPNNFVRGQWYVFEIEAMTNQVARGYLKVTLDGTQVVDYSGPLGYGCSSYWEHGLYRDRSPETIAAKVKNMTATW
jgi:hypothetical protein